VIFILIFYFLCDFYHKKGKKSQKLENIGLILLN